MKKEQVKKIVAGAALTTFALMLGGCSGSGKQTTESQEEKVQTTDTEEQGASQSNHEALTMMTSSSNDYSAFIEALHKVYPEINIELVSYKGYNTTEYNNTLLKAGDITDIFVATYPPVDELQKENLYDLSGEDFISNVNLKMISDVSVDGAVYLLPTNISLFGVYYNKTLFEEHGWSVPNSMKELEELIPQIEAAGVNLSECSTQFLGATFAYFFDSAAPEYITTLDGISWMEDYLSGEATATGNLESSVENFQHLIDLGLFHIGETTANDKETLARFKEGNTAFLITNSSQSFYENSDGTGDEYGLMPYLSEDGDNNIVITNVTTYFGISKTLEENPQKLEDALNVMAFVATPEGQESLVVRENTISPLKNDLVSEDSPLYEMSLLVDEGKSMALIYSGWEDYVVGIGQSAYDMMNGEMTGEEFLTSLDELQATVMAEGGLPALADVEEDLDKEQVAQLVGAAFAQAADADCALISIGDYHGTGKENDAGINGKVYSSVILDTNVVSTFNPLGWSKTIKVMTLTGAEIKAFAEEGFYKGSDPTPFEYVLVTKNGETLEDDTVYTVACTEESDERAEQGKLTDTELVGQDALVEYIQQLGTINSETILWK